MPGFMYLVILHRCAGAVFEAEKVTIKDDVYHKRCFNCRRCARALDSLVPEVKTTSRGRAPTRSSCRSTAGNTGCDERSTPIATYWTFWSSLGATKPQRNASSASCFAVGASCGF